MKYPATFTREPEGIVVAFRDLPEAITQGDDEDDAMVMARDVLRETMGVYLSEKRPVPLPSKARRGEQLVELPPSVAAKVFLMNEMLAQDVAPSELARRMGTTRQEVNRLTDLEHSTKIDRIADAISALGKHLELGIGNDQSLFAQP
ncbi:type II toxin-antitoxin system HicB family antitoxin [Massilia agilis]|uniref:Type II toxin-antitoxin system HicB family antitoxin n=1 Tax=Massilia agilis TaxID=1811226 RepID=A0ABT2DBH5_9BURK|nr:type II toxin-antitoxin system HicB family antitoxin [Massilia agilis]MCS0808670.1 type II toxin-antitoxin system HicB family antitoxin [Massilia agilis]